MFKENDEVYLVNEYFHEGIQPKKAKILKISGNHAVVGNENEEYEFSISIIVNPERKEYALLSTGNTAVKCFLSMKDFEEWTNIMKQKRLYNASYGTATYAAQYAFIKQNSAQ